MAGINIPYEFPYETVAAGQTAQVLGGTGATGDYIDKLIVTVATAASGTVALLDDTTSIPITAANTAIGVYTVQLGILSKNGAWKVTTGAGATVIAVGRFSA
jgi:hypothetical protein